MKTLILATSQGTRVCPVADIMPKPINLIIINKPEMTFLMEHLRRFCVHQIVVNSSDRDSQIKAYFDDGAHVDVEMALCGDACGGNVLPNAGEADILDRTLRLAA